MACCQDAPRKTLEASERKLFSFPRSLNFKKPVDRDRFISVPPTLLSFNFKGVVFRVNKVLTLRTTCQERAKEGGKAIERAIAAWIDEHDKS